MDPFYVANIIISIFVMLLSLTVHEYAHAEAAYRLGDDTAERLGRRSLNPLSHIDPIGTILFPLLGVLLKFPVFGWAKPVPVAPVKFTHRIQMKTGMLIVSAAGPLANVALALLGTAALLAVNQIAPQALMNQHLQTFFHMFILINLFLAVFNLMPIPPLDGSKILYGLLPDAWGRQFLRLEPYAFLMLMLLVFSGGINFLAKPVMAAYAFLLNLILG